MFPLSSHIPGTVIQIKGFAHYLVKGPVEYGHQEAVSEG